MGAELTGHVDPLSCKSLGVARRSRPAPEPLGDRGGVAEVFAMLAMTTTARVTPVRT